KFKHSGPVIGLCLLVTLAACLTLAPAILRGCGDVLFWPSRVGRRATTEVARTRRLDRRLSLWWVLARGLTARPGVVLVLSVVALAPLAAYGWRMSDHVTFDFLRSLPLDRPARAGAELLRGH